MTEPTTAIARADVPELAGRVVRVNGPLVEVEGLARVAVRRRRRGRRRGAWPPRSSRSSDGLVTAQVYEYTGGLRVGDRAAGLGRPLSARLGPGLLGGIFDGLLRPLAGRAHVAGARRARAGRRPGDAGGSSRLRRPAHRACPGAGPRDRRDGLGRRPPRAAPVGARGEVEWIAEADERRRRRRDRDDRRSRRSRSASCGRCARRGRRGPGSRSSVPLVTGQRVVDLLFPIAKGATAAVPGGFGTGKTMLLQQIVKWCDADVIVFVGCGERGNELADALADLAALEDPRTGGTPAGAHRGDRQHLQHAGDGARGQHLHRHDGRRVLPRHGLRHACCSPTRPRAGRRRCASSPRAAANCRPKRAIRRGCPRRWRRSTNAPAA